MVKNRLSSIILVFLFSFLFISMIGSNHAKAQSTAPTAVYTYACIGDNVMCEERDPDTGQIITVLNGPGKEPGIEAETWFYFGPVVDDDNDGIPDEIPLGARKRVLGGGSFFGYNTNYNCGWPCLFWPY